MCGLMRATMRSRICWMGRRGKETTSRIRLAQQIQQPEADMDFRLFSVLLPAGEKGAVIVLVQKAGKGLWMIQGQRR